MGKLRDLMNMTRAERSALSKEKTKKTSNRRNKPEGGFDSFLEKTINDNLKRMQGYYNFNFSHHDQTKNLHWYDYNKYSVRYERIGISESQIINDKIHHIYEPDFYIEKQDGSFYIEVKGYFPQEDRHKMIRVRECNPDVEIKFLFEKEQKLKNSERTNVDWCVEHKFDYSIGKMLKKEWFK